jgi:hypothetical protein
LGTIVTSFSGGVLPFDAFNRSLRIGTCIITGITNTISSLTITNARNNGLYFVAISNNGSGNLTINTGLGANIRTTHSNAITIAFSGSALMTINVITLNSIQTTIVDVKSLIS